jgi:hypothetical protein
LERQKSTDRLVLEINNQQSKIDNVLYNPPMGGFIEPSPPQQRDSNWLPIVLGIGLVVVVVAGIAWLSRTQPKTASIPHPYISNLKLADLKMSAAENFVGASVTYLDGTVTNVGDRAVTHAVVRVTFKDSLGQVAQEEQVALRVLQPSGPTLDAVDLSMTPLSPGQSNKFRLTFEHVSASWNQEYPQVEVMDVSLK